MTEDRLIREWKFGRALSQLASQHSHAPSRSEEEAPPRRPTTMPAAAGGLGASDDPTTAEAATFTYSTRCGRELVLHQSRRSFNCGTTLWSAGQVLAGYLEQEKALFKHRSSMRVLELGAGLGLAGIVAALQVSK